MPSARKKCICQICTCGRHMCLHQGKDSHLVLGEDAASEVNREIFEAKERGRKLARQWSLSNGEAQEISAAVDQINAQQVLANATSRRATAISVDSKGNSQTHVNGTGNRWSSNQIPKRLPIRPPDTLKPCGEVDFTTVHQSDYSQGYPEQRRSFKNLNQYSNAAEIQQASWNHKQIPKTLSIKKPDTLTLTGPFNLETTNKKDYNETIFHGKATEYAEGDTSHRPRTSLKLSGEFQSDSSYQRAFTPKHAKDIIKVKKGTSVSNLKPEGDMIFDTTSLDYNAAINEQIRSYSNDSSVALKPKLAKPQSGIKIPEVPLEDETTAVTDYRRWNVEKPERHKPPDTLKLDHGITDVDEYSSGLSSKVYSDVSENDARWRVSRPVLRKPQNNLKPEGNFNFETTSDIDYTSRRSRYSQSYLETVTERTETTEILPETKIAPTENNSEPAEKEIAVAEIPHQDTRVEKEYENVIDEGNQIDVLPKAIPPELQVTETERNLPQSAKQTQYEGVSDNSDYVAQNGEQMEYVTWDQIRPKPIRPHSNLRQEGGMEFNTTNRSAFIQRASERVKGVRPKTTTKVSEGNFDSTTMNQVMFHYDQPERVNPIRPKSNLHLENGHFENETTTAREYQQWEIKRPSPIIHKSNLRTSSGAFNSETTNKAQFQEYHIDRPKPIRPISNLHQEGSMDFTTMNQLQFEEKAIEKVSQFRPQSSSKITGEFDGMTTNRVMYAAQPIQKSQLIKPKGNIEIEKGEFAQNTTNQSEYQQWQGSKPQPVTPRNNLQQEGSMDFTTTNQLQYATKTAERVSQIRPRSNPKVTGEFDGTTTNQMMYQNIPGEKSKAVRPKTNLQLERGYFTGETTNSKEFQTWGYEKPSPIKPHSSIRQEGKMDFTTTNNTQFEEKKGERVQQIRPTTSTKVSGDFDGTTTNQVMYQNNTLETVRGKRPSTNIHLESGRFEDQTTNRREYQQWEMAKAEPIRPSGTLAQEGKMEFTTSNQTEFGEKTITKAEQIRPHTTSPITGEFDGTTTNQVMYQGQLMDKVHDIRPRDNLKIENGDFKSDTTTSREYGYKSGGKPELIVPKPNLSQDGDFDFVTSNQMQYEEKPIDRQSKTRPKTHTKVSEEKFGGKTMNQTMFQVPEMDPVHSIRPPTNLRTDEGTFQSNTTSTDAYHQWKTERPKAYQLATSLKQEGNMTFETTSSSEYGQKAYERTQQIRPKTSSKIEGEFETTTTNQAMFHQPENLDRVKPIRHQNNIQLEHGKFAGETTTSREYRQWVKNEKQIAVPKKKLQAAGIRTQREGSSYKAEETKMKVKDTNSKEENEAWKIADVQASGDRALNSSKIPLTDDSRKAGETESFTGPAEETQKEISGQQTTVSESIGEKEQISRDVSTMRADYEGKQGTKAQSIVPPSHLRQSGETGFTTISRDVSTMKADYEGKQGTKAQSIVPPSHLGQSGEIGFTTTSIDVSTMKADYEGKQGTKSQSIVPPSHLGQSGETGYTTTSIDVSTTKADYEGKQGTKSQSIVPPSHLGQSGETGYTTTSIDMSTMKADYEGKQGTKSQSIVPPSHLGQSGETGYTTTSIDMSTMKADYEGKQGTKSQSIVPPSHLRQSGEIGFTTTSKHDYSEKANLSRNMRQDEQLSNNKLNVENVKGSRYKPQDNLTLEHVPFNGSSTTKAEYKKWEGRRSSSKRRSENLKQEGRMQFDTTSNDYSVLKDYQMNREAIKSKIKDELKKGTLTSTGSMEFSTTSKTSYIGAAKGARAKNLRPRSSLRLGISNNTNQEMMSSSRSNPETSTRENYDLTSTSRASYVGYTGTRTRANRPSTSQKVGQGAFEGQTTSRSSFTKHEEAAIKPKTHKPENHNILDTQNGFSGNTTYKSSFETKKGHCPVLDLEAGKSQLAFNEEKNGHIFYAPRVQG